MRVVSNLRFVIAFLAILHCGIANAQFSFQGLGFLPSSFETDANAVSADGSTVVGITCYQGSHHPLCQPPLFFTRPLQLA